MIDAALSDAVRPHKICLVICYIGRPPAGIEVFFKSCEKNPGVHFFIFSDCIPSDHAPANVTIVPSTLDSLAQLASQTVGFPVILDHPYKLCDFKLLYGKMFEDYLAPYDFWGMTDLDVIFGDIRAFITDEMLAAYDVITGRRDYIVGHFTLYRNIPPFDALYLESRDYRRVFQTRTCLSITESDCLSAGSCLMS